MIPPFNAALSGLAVSSRRLQVSAENISNQFSTRTLVDGQSQNTPYVPKEVVQTSLPTGGVRAEVRDKNPATTTVFSPDSPDANADGTLTLPNVNLEDELVNQKIASYDYKANLKVIKVQDDLDKSLLDIFS